MRCAVYGCISNNTKKKSSKNNVNTWGKVHYHSFPKDEWLHQQWVDYCGRPNPVNEKSPHICSLHFVESDYTFNDLAAFYGLPVSKKLKPNSVPSRHLFEHNATEDPISTSSTCAVL